MEIKAIKTISGDIESSGDGKIKVEMSVEVPGFNDLQDVFTFTDKEGKLFCRYISKYVQAVFYK